MKGKKFSILASVLIIALFGSIPVFAAGADASAAYIETTAVGEVKAAPDIAYLNFQIRTEADNSETAQQNNAKAVNKAIDLLTAKGLMRKEIYTVYYNSYSYTKTEVRPLGTEDPALPNYARSAEIYPAKEKNEVTVYVTESTLRATVNDLSTVGRLLADLAAIPEVRVNNVNYALRDVLPYKQEAITRAIREARQTIDCTAAGLGVELAGLRSVRVDFNNYYYAPVYAKAMAGAFDAAASVPQPQNPEDITVTATVYIAYYVK